MFTTCARTACKIPLTRGYWNIKNNGDENGRNYCPKCGRKIVSYSKLEYMCVTDRSPVVFNKRAENEQRKYSF